MSEFRLFAQANAIDLSQDQEKLVVGGNQILQVFRVSVNDTKSAPQLDLLQDVGGTNLTTNDVKWNLHVQNCFASASSGGNISVWSVGQGRVHRCHDLAEHNLSANRVSWNNDAEYLLLSGSQTGEVKLWDMRVSKSVLTFTTKSINEPIYDIQFCPHNRFTFASAFPNSMIQIWDTRYPRGHTVKLQSAHNGNVLSINWHPQIPGVLASGGGDSFIRVWDLRYAILGGSNSNTSYESLKSSNRNSGAKVQPLYKVATPGKVTRLRWRPGYDTQIASASSFNELHLWDLEHPHVPVACFPGHSFPALGFEFTSSKPTFPSEPKVWGDNLDPDDDNADTASSFAYDSSSLSSSGFGKSHSLVSPGLQSPWDRRRGQGGGLDLMRTVTMDQNRRGKFPGSTGSRLSRQVSTPNFKSFEQARPQRKQQVPDIQTPWDLKNAIVSFTVEGVIRFHHMDEATQLLKQTRGLGISISIHGELACVYDQVKPEHTTLALTEPHSLPVETDEITHKSRAACLVKLFQGQPVAAISDLLLPHPNTIFPHFQAEIYGDSTSIGAVLGFDAKRFTRLAKGYRFPTLILTKEPDGNSDELKLTRPTLTNDEIARYCDHNATIASQAGVPHLCQMWLTVKLLLIPPNLSPLTEVSNHSHFSLDQEYAGSESDTDSVSSRATIGSTEYSHDERNVNDSSRRPGNGQNSDSEHNESSSETSYSGVSASTSYSIASNTAEHHKHSHEKLLNQSTRKSNKHDFTNTHRNLKEITKPTTPTESHVRWKLSDGRRKSKITKTTVKHEKAEGQKRNSERNRKSKLMNVEWWNRDLFNDTDDSYLLDQTSDETDQVPGLWMNESKKVLSFLNTVSPLPDDSFELSGRYYHAPDAVELQALLSRPAAPLLVPENTQEARWRLSQKHSKAVHQVRVVAHATSGTASKNEPELGNLGNIDCCIPTDLSNCTSGLLHDILEHHAEQGDVQTCVTLLLVVGSRIYPSVDDISTLKWFDGYVSLLQRLKLFAIATFVYSNCHLEQVRNRNEKNTTIRSGCIKTSEMHQAQNSSMCVQCKEPSATCSICKLHVRGVFVWCRGCKHGGHLKHMSKWFANNSQCPTGCGHHCSIPGIVDV